MAEPQLTFLVHEPGVEARRVTTAQSVVKIGRNASATLTLTSPKVSRMHAVVEVHEGTLSVIDLGSEPQTAVNGTPVQKHPLRPGDKIQIADCVIVLEAVSESVSSPEGGWNWGDAPAPVRGERNAAGPIVVIALFLLGVVGFLLLR